MEAATQLDEDFKACEELKVKTICEFTEKKVIYF